MKFIKALAKLAISGIVGVLICSFDSHRKTNYLKSVDTTITVPLGGNAWKQTARWPRSSKT